MVGRSKQREQAFLLIFQDIFGGEYSEAIELLSEETEPVGDFAKALFVGVKENADELDSIIEAHLSSWKLKRIPKVNLAILRLAIYEIKYVEDVPASVAINEAVELAKTYSGKEDASFVNGVLGAYVRGLE